MSFLLKEKRKLPCYMILSSIFFLFNWLETPAETVGTKLKY